MDNIKQIAENYHEPINHSSYYIGAWICNCCKFDSFQRHKLIKDNNDNETIEVCSSCLLKINKYWLQNNKNKIAEI